MKKLVFPVTAYKQNCTFVLCNETNKAAVIDPGGDVDKLLAIIEKHSLDIEKILLTHGHLDHVGGTVKLQAALAMKGCDVPVIGPHKDDLFWIEQLPMQSEMMGLGAVESFVPQQWLEGGDQVSVGNMVFDVIHCPGHTPGHVVFYNKKAGWAQVGDVIFAGSIGRTDFPKSNHDDLISSIRDKLFLLGDDVSFVPGHGPASTIGEERKSNPFVADARYR